MTNSCIVWSDLGGQLVRVGLAETRGRSGVFNYVDAYVQDRMPAIDPINLPLASRRIFTTSGVANVWGVLNDAGPDSWGKKVLKVLEPDWLAGASPIDILIKSSGRGVGSLMFTEKVNDQPVRQRGISRADLNAAAEGAHTVEIGEIPRAQLRELLRASVSAGGMHPKIAVTDPDGSEWLAKFRSVEDIVDTPCVEGASMQLAKLCGIDAADVLCTATAERSSLLVRRFDRENGIEHYASADALFNRDRLAGDRRGTWASYAGVANLRRQLPGHGVGEDLRELFRRMVFNVIIGNTDDHARNHGFVMNTRGQWRLSKAFDVLPNFRNQNREHALEIGPRGTEGSFENVMEGAADFGLDAAAAAGIVQEVAAGVREHFPGLLDQARCPPADKTLSIARCHYPPADL